MCDDALALRLTEYKMIQLISFNLWSWVQCGTFNSSWKDKKKAVLFLSKLKFIDILLNNNCKIRP